MSAMRYVSFSAVLLVLSLQAQAADTQMKWLSKEATKEAPYTFLSAASQKVTLPSETYGGWSVFNASKAAFEAAQEYDVSAESDADGVGAGMLRFNGQIADENAYLTLGISKSSTGDAQDPVIMEPNPGEVRIDNIYARMRFAESAELPAADEVTGILTESFTQMYPSYAESQYTEAGAPTFTTPKLGICVLEDGYFHITRVSAGEIDEATGAAADYTYQFVQTNHTYAEVGGGEVIIRVEFKTYVSQDTYNWHRAYSIYAKATTEGAKEICLTEGIGYPWEVAEGVYKFDFTKQGEGEWLYPLDDAVAAADPTAEMASAPIDQLNRIGFSATEGGFYAAWMDETTTADVFTLATYDTGAFAPFVAEPNAYFDLYTDWIATYDVDATAYFQEKTSTAQTLSLYDTSVATAESELTQHAFDAFLLYMDPETDAPLRLNVTGMVTESDTISFTITGPDGCNLREAISRAARLRIRRSADLATLASATSTEYDIAFSLDGTSASFALPRVEDDTELPFMQATLVPITECE